MRSEILKLKLLYIMMKYLYIREDLLAKEKINYIILAQLLIPFNDF